MSSTVQKLQFSAEKIIVIAFPFMQIVVYACMICVAWFGGNDIIVGKMQLGDFTAFLSYIMQILMSLIMVAMGFMNIVMSRASLDRIVEILDEKSTSKTLQTHRISKSKTAVSISTTSIFPIRNPAMFSILKTSTCISGAVKPSVS